MSRTRPAALLLSAVLSISCSEYGLRDVPEGDSDVPTDPIPEDPGSPWDDLDGTDRPQALLAATWFDLEPGTLRRSGWRCAPPPSAAPRYGFFDLDLQLLLEVAAPNPDYRPPPTPFQSLASSASRLVPAGPSSFLTVSADGTPGLRHAWIGDGDAETSADVLTWSVADWGADAPAASLTLASGTSVDLPHPVLDVLVAPDLHSPDVLWLAPLHRTLDLDPNTPLLYRVPADDPSRARTWDTATLTAGTALVGMPGVYPSSMHLLRRGGADLVMLGLVGAEPDGERLAVRGPGVVVLFDPDGDEVVWSVEVSFGPFGPSAGALDGNGSPSWLSPSFPNGQGLAANLDRRDGPPTVIEIAPETDTTWTCPQTANLLDTETGTAIFVAVREHQTDLIGSSVLMTHRGERLLRIDGVREGLRRSDVLIDALTLLSTGRP